MGLVGSAVDIGSVYWFALMIEVAILSWLVIKAIRCFDSLFLAIRLDTSLDDIGVLFMQCKYDRLLFIT